MQIRHQICVSRKCLGHIKNATFSNLLRALLIDSMRLQEGFLLTFWAFSGLSSHRWDQRLILPPEQYACCSAAIKHGEINDDLKKLFESHPKDFAVRQKLAETSIVQCDFTFKMTHPPSVTKLSNTSTHKGKTRQCVTRTSISKSETAWLVLDVPRKSILSSSIQKIRFFFGSCRKNLLNVAILPVKTPFSRKHLCYFCPDFW